jgi:hypothetical protein
MCAYNLNVKPSDLMKDLDSVDVDDENNGQEGEGDDDNDGDDGDDNLQVIVDAAPQVRHIQKHACDIANEVAWFHHYKTLSPDERVLALENMGKMGRSWLQQLPVCPATSLTDEEVRHGLRCIMLDPMVMSSNQGGSSGGNGVGVCRCGVSDGPMHHLACKNTSVLRTKRHTAIKDAINTSISSMTRLPTMIEAKVAQGVIADIVVTMDNGRVGALDVAVVSTHGHVAPEPDEPNTSSWASHLQPSHDEPSASSSSTTPLDPNIHPAKVVREFRSGCFEGAIGTWLDKAEGRKQHHYRSLTSVGTSFWPIIISSGGCMGKSACEFIKCLSKWSKGGQGGKKELRFLYGRIGVVLLRYSSRMSRAAIQGGGY